MLQLLSCSRTQNMKLGAAIKSQSYVEEHIGGMVQKWVDYQKSTSCCIYSIYFLMGRWTILLQNVTDIDSPTAL